MTEQPKDQPDSDGEATPMSDAALAKVAGGFPTDGYDYSYWCEIHGSTWPCQGDGTHSYMKITPP